MHHPSLIWTIVAIQVVCAFFFVFDLVATIFLLPVGPLNWQVRETIEIGAALGLAIGSGLGVSALYSMRARTAKVEAQLRAASGAFHDVLEERFTDWGLTPAERDVAMFSIKGVSIPDIAEMRSTSEGTVKAQTNAIYRKAGVNGRSQLLSLFIEELMEAGAG